MLRACGRIAPCSPGKTKITKGYDLPVKVIIHTVGPKDKQAAVLKQCYQNSRRMMALNNLRTTILPSIATGSYGYPLKDAALVALNSTISWLHEGSNREEVDVTVFCAHMMEDFSCYDKQLKALEASMLIPAPVTNAATRPQTT